MEQWKSVVGYEGLYEVSDYGRVRSLSRSTSVIQAKRAYCQVTKGRDLGFGYDRGRGYRFIALHADGVKTQKSVHQLVLEAFVGPCPDGMEACHFPDRDPSNNKLANLRWDTSKSNCVDRSKHGTTLVGERHHQAKLTAGCVARAKDMRALGCTWLSIGDWFGVSFHTVRAAVIGRNWRHLVESS